MALLLDRVKQFFLHTGWDKTYWVGFSGGIDSHVLLHLCAELRKSCPLQIKAVHVHHGLSVHASEWALHCQKVCENLKIELIQKSIEAKAFSGDSPEEKARDLRYAVFAECMAPQDILLTAHQEEDQAETLLVQLFRGAGPKGLSAMPALKSFANGFHARPLLNTSRAEIKKYAEQNQLSWIDDESNDDTRFTRNFLRHSVLPLLQERWPTVTHTLARVAENCAETEEFIARVVLDDLKNCYGNNHFTLSIQKLMLFDAVRQRQILRTWFSECGFAIPSSVKLHQIQQDFLLSQSDKLPVMRWDQTELRRYRNMLYLMKPLTEHDPTQVFTWDLKESLMIPGIGKLQATGLNAQQVTVGFRQGGERCYFPKRHCHQLLKNLMQEWGIPPWERDRIPLIFIDEELVAVVGFFMHEQYQTESCPPLLFSLSPSFD